jgi:hypothetical protein
MTENLNVGALSIQGSLLWTDETQSAQDEMYLCAGYVVTKTGGNFYMDLSSPLHHPFQMGWRIGDRIGVAPTE